jgi:hypothetical protein
VIPFLPSFALWRARLGIPKYLRPLQNPSKMSPFLYESVSRFSADSSFTSSILALWGMFPTEGNVSRVNAGISCFQQNPRHSVKQLRLRRNLVYRFFPSFSALAIWSWPRFQFNKPYSNIQLRKGTWKVQLLRWSEIQRKHCPMKRIGGFVR